MEQKGIKKITKKAKEVSKKDKPVKVETRGKKAKEVSKKDVEMSYRRAFGILLQFNSNKNKSDSDAKFTKRLLSQMNLTLKRLFR